MRPGPPHPHTPRPCAHRHAPFLQAEYINFMSGLIFELRGTVQGGRPRKAARLGDVGSSPAAASTQLLGGRDVGGPGGEASIFTRASSRREDHDAVVSECAMLCFDFFVKVRTAGRGGGAWVEKNNNGLRVSPRTQKIVG
jgi:hypothetical protein